jgi:hypothetical protein
MGVGGGGGGSQKSTTTQSSHLPAFEQPLAKAYISALAGLVFPGMQMPENWMPKGWDFNPSGGSGGTPGASQGQPMQGGGGTGPVSNVGSGAPSPGGQPSPQSQIGTPGLDPTLAYNLMNPIIGSSPYLQNMYAQNPGAITSAMSPAAFNQLGNPLIYGSMGLG